MIALTLAIAAQTAGGLSLSTVNGAMIATECSKSSTLNLDTCVSYILGVADTLQLDDKTCHAPSEAWTLQTVTIARRYIHDHPEKWGQAPAFLIRDALTAAFPCPASGRSR